MVKLLAEIKRIPPLEAARLIWIEGVELLGFPMGWTMSELDWEELANDIGKWIENVQRNHTKLFEGK